MKPSTRCRITELAETLLKMLGSSPLPERGGHTRWHGLSGVATWALLTSSSPSPPPPTQVCNSPELCNGHKQC